MKFAILVLVFPLFSFAHGGAGTVGDGGHGVTCGRNVELLDIYEHRKANEQITLNPRMSLPTMIAVLTYRLENDSRFAGQDFTEFNNALKNFRDSTPVPFEFNVSDWEYRLQTRKPQLSQEVMDRMKADSCRLTPVAVRGYSDKFTQPSARICDGEGYCFIVNSRLYRRFSKANKACLFIHEALRFLPQPLSENELRRVTFEICTK